MARVKRGLAARKKRKKILKRAEGFYAANGSCYIHAREKVDRALVYAYRDRKVRKRDFRALWIQRIGAACKLNGLSYSRFVHGLTVAGVELDRKSLADLAVKDPASFAEIVRIAQTASGTSTTAA